MASVIIHGDKAAAPIRLNLNGRRLVIPINTATPVPPDFLAVLEASDISFERLDAPVSAPPQAGEDGGGADHQGAGAAADTAPEPVSVLIPADFLDRSVAAILPDLEGMSAAELEALRAAETGGKTRKSLIAAIEAHVAAKTEG